jgi:hypothetical protein
VRKPGRLQVLLSRDKVRAIFTELDAVPRLICSLPHGAGMILVDQVRYLDFGSDNIILSRGKDLRDRITMPQGDLLVVDERREGSLCHRAS